MINFVDVLRTFPENVHFQEEAEDTQVTPLRNVLAAYANHNPTVGYCQVSMQTNGQRKQTDKDTQHRQIDRQLDKHSGQQTVTCVCNFIVCFHCRE